jgi:hypothetical protein
MAGKKKQTKFIATLDENKIQHIDKFAKTFKDDGVKARIISSLGGIISGQSNESLEELKMKYEPKGLKIEPDRSVGF